jgi:hypothetical protein
MKMITAKQIDPVPHIELDAFVIMGITFTAPFVGLRIPIAFTLFVSRRSLAGYRDLKNRSYT